MPPSNPSPPDPGRSQASDQAAPVRLDAGLLFAQGREVIIVHAAETYRLRLTRQDKLILTK